MNKVVKNLRPFDRSGAGSENRTRATRSEAWHSTTKLYPQLTIYILAQIKKYNKLKDQKWTEHYGLLLNSTIYLT